MPTIIIYIYNDKDLLTSFNTGKVSAIALEFYFGLPFNIGQ